MISSANNWVTNLLLILLFLLLTWLPSCSGPVPVHQRGTAQDQEEEKLPLQEKEEG